MRASGPPTLHAPSLLIIFKKMQTGVSRPDAALGLILEEAGRRPVRGQSRLTTMELQQIPAACLPVSREAGSRSLKAKIKPQTNKQPPTPKKSPGGVGGICVRTTAPGLAATPGSDAGVVPQARPAC